MRIGLVAPPGIPVPPEAYGGIEAVVDRLARGLDAAGHHVVLAAAPDSTVPVTTVPGTDDGTGAAPENGDLNSELRHVLTAYAAMEDVDLIHDHTVAGPLCHPPTGGAPIVTTAHGPFDGEMLPLYRAMEGVPVIAISHDQASRSDGVPIRAVIHHGIDVAQVPVGRGDGGYACFLGRMTPDKGPREAAQIARAAGIPLRMAAKMREPAEKEYFKAEVEPLLGSGVEYVGEAGWDDKIALLGGAVALLNPLGWSEPFGLVMIEALATGTPVVATPCGSVPEIVEDGVTGYVDADHEALARALVAAADLDRGACRSAAERRFDTARMVEDHLRVYESVLAEKEGADPEGGASVTTSTGAR
ncbi:glycosyltransferase family 4 protein [Mumia sp. DW29H23]|uniref:glycosyltransferase family 4 protein n=1 Tax=Mumia sp. DW29H23 TaxID=3421241 RepID=UPI003D69B279